MVRNMADMVAEIVAGMRRKHAREDEFSASDDEIAVATNRGNKLKRNARYVQEGMLTTAEGSLAHPQRITHATFSRNIVYRNPKLYDEDGIELSGSESDEDADGIIAEENPYREIHIDHILEPIMRASDVPSNQYYSLPYTSTALTDMVKEAEKQLQAARSALWKAKNLLTEFRGDELWVPTGAVESEEDFEIFYPKRLKLDVESGSKAKPKQHHSTSVVQQKGSAEELSVGDVVKPDLSLENNAAEGVCNGQPAAEDVEMTDAPTNGIVTPNSADGELPENSAARDEMEQVEDDADSSQVQPQQPPHARDGAAGDATASDQPNGTKPNVESPKDQDSEPLEKILSKDSGAVTADSNAPANAPERSQVDPEEGDATPPPPVRRMTTRAQAQAASTSLENSNSSDSHTRSQSPATSTYSSNYIDPLYLLPESAMPDRDFGLPPPEADETRRLLMTYIQKQEEVVRGHERIFEGLSRADRSRKMVFEWCKADGHTGELSDGEDWYDKEFWGLEEDLKKGVDDEEETETAGPQNQGKRRGGRRA